MGSHAFYKIIHKKECFGLPSVAQTITYNSFGKVSSISEANGSQTINAYFTYNSDNQRAKMTVGVYYGSEIMTRYYVGEAT